MPAPTSEAIFEIETRYGIISEIFKRDLRGQF
jgi:hypothetical protein